MSAYHTFMRKFNEREGINSFYGSDKERFQREWREEKIRTNPPKDKPLAPRKKIEEAPSETQQKIVGIFSNDYEQYFAITPKGNVLQLDMFSPKHSIVYDGTSVENAFKWIKENVRGLVDDSRYSHNLLKDKLIKDMKQKLEKYNLEPINVSDKIKILFAVDRVKNQKHIIEDWVLR